MAAPEGYEYNASDNIVAVICKDRNRIPLVKEYVDNLVEKQAITADNVHMWDFSQDDYTSRYMKSQGWLPAQTSGLVQKYFAPQAIGDSGSGTVDGSILLKVRGKSDLHVLFRDENDYEYELVIGAFGNTKTVLRKGKGGHVLAETNELVLDPIALNTIKIEWVNNITDNNDTPLKGKVKISLIKKGTENYTDPNAPIILKTMTFTNVLRSNKKFMDYQVASGFGSELEFEWDDSETPKYRTFQGATDDLSDFISFYYNRRGSIRADVLIKIDDEVVCVDNQNIGKLSVKAVNSPNAMMIIPMTIGEPTHAYIQQTDLSIPRSELACEFPFDDGVPGKGGNLTRDGDAYYKYHMKMLDYPYAVTKAQEVDLMPALHVRPFMYAVSMRQLDHWEGVTSENDIVKVALEKNLNRILFKEFFCSAIDASMYEVMNNCVPNAVADIYEKYQEYMDSTTTRKISGTFETEGVTADASDFTGADVENNLESENPNP